MNKTFRLLCLSTASLILASCGTNSSSLSSSSQKTTDSTQITSSKTGEGTSATSSNQTTSSTGTTTSVTPIPSIDIPTSLEETKGDDFISTEDGSLTIYENVYTIVAGGTYTVTGTKEAQIRVNAPEGEVELDLADAHISYAYNSPIYCYEAASLDISAKSGTSNSVTDLRGVEAIEDEYQGNGAIYSKVDLKLKGSGTLDVTGTYNNGVHSTKDLTVQKLTLHVTAPNNALKGNDSVTIKSGTLNIVSTGGDGIKTTDSDISSKEKQRGTVSILDGAIDIYSACDGIDASYNVEVSGGTTNIKTYKYSPYTGEIFANSTTDMYLRTTVAHSNSSRYSVYFYDDAGNFKWSDASFLKSENVQEGGGGKGPGGGGSTTTYNYYELERPANFGNFKIYSFASNQEDSTEDYLACSKGGTINQNYDTVTFSLNNGSISIGSWTNYEAQSQGGKGGEGNSQKKQCFRQRLEGR